MAEHRDELLAHYRATRAGLLAAVDGLSDDLLCERSLDGWSVKDHLAHLAFWDDLRAGEVERISAGYASAWRIDGAADEAVNTVATAARWELPLAQVRWELGHSRRRLMAAIANATDRGLDPTNYGEAGLNSGHEAQHTAWILRWRAEKGV